MLLWTLMDSYSTVNFRVTTTENVDVGLLYNIMIYFVFRLTCI